MKLQFYIPLSLLFIACSPSLDGRYCFDQIDDGKGNILKETQASDPFLLKADGSFHYSIESLGLTAKGTYIRKGDSLIFTYAQPSDTIRGYQIDSLSHKRLVLSEGGVKYRFNSCE